MSDSEKFFAYFALLIAYVLWAALLSGCVNRTIYYPPTVWHDAKGGQHARAFPAVIEDGDLLGPHQVIVTNRGVRYIAQGSLDNSTSTRIIYKEVGGMVKTGITAAGAAAATMGIVGPVVPK